MGDSTEGFALRFHRMSFTGAAPRPGDLGFVAATRRQHGRGEGAQYRSDKAPWARPGFVAVARIGAGKFLGFAAMELGIGCGAMNPFDIGANKSVAQRSS